MEVAGPVWGMRGTDRPHANTTLVAPNLATLTSEASDLSLRKIVSRDLVRKQGNGPRVARGLVPVIAASPGDGWM
jgi:hypothetical protein